MCVVYKALDDTLMMDFVGAFLELWLRMVYLELWLRMGGKHVSFLELLLGIASLELWLGMKDNHWTFFELWLRMVYVTSVSVQVVTCTEGLHLIEQS